VVTARQDCFRGDGNDASAEAIAGAAAYAVAVANGRAPPAAKRVKASPEASPSEKVAASPGQPAFAHFAAANLLRFEEAHKGNGQGVAALAFALPVGGLAKVRQNYETKHPALLAGGPTAAAVAAYEEGGVTVQVCGSSLIETFERAFSRRCALKCRLFHPLAIGSLLSGGI